ncbi:MAG: hypothetical protein WC732_00050 [Candidatus Omnitrophota bacterium]
MIEDRRQRTEDRGPRRHDFRRGLRVFCLLLSVFCLLGMAKAPKKKVYVKTLKDGSYQLMVQGRPFVVKGVCYNPIPIGKSHDHDFWNDPEKPWLVDGALMKKMGVNAVRFYQPGEDLEAARRVIAELYQKFGIRTMMGHWLGFWNYPAPFYDDPEFRKKVKEDLLRTVEALKGEEGLLFWVLGNENNYSFSGKVNPWTSERIEKLGDPRQCMLARAQTYYSFVNELAREIHRIDPDHPVVMGNGELICLDLASEFAPDVDIVGCIIYRGKTFGNIFKGLRNTFDKPLVLIEFGADAYNAQDKKEDEDMQAFFLKSQWGEIYKNLAGSPDGAGNCLGGVMFEWTDEWWKHNEWDPAGWSVQDTASNWSNGSYYLDIQAERNMNMNEEWFGIVKLVPEDAPEKEGQVPAVLDRRQPRKAYYDIREFWKDPKTKRNPRK